MSAGMDQFLVALAIGAAVGYLVIRPLRKKAQGKKCGGNCCVPGKKPRARK